MPVVIDESSLGSRVVIRFRRADSGDRPLSDVVGELVGLDDEQLTVHSRSGVVRVARSSIVAARPVAADRRSVLELQMIMAQGWRAAETEDIDGWLLRADGGWTRRANSALPLRTSHTPLPELLSAIEAFYAQRGLGSLIQVPLPARGVLDAELARRCWTIEAPVVVLTRPLSSLGAQAEPVGAEQIVLEDSPSPAWQRGYHARDGVLSQAALELLVRHDTVTFARGSASGDSTDTGGIARGTVDSGWLGVTALEVAPAARRQGVAAALMARLESWGRASGADRAYLQVEADNEAALRLYRRLGYLEHHRYHYRRPPARSAE